MARAVCVATLVVAASGCSRPAGPVLTDERLPSPSIAPRDSTQGASEDVVVHRGPMPDPAVAPGQWIVITPEGLRPQLLVATVELPIVFENRTNEAVRMRYDNGTVDSGLIAPGASFRATPDAAVAITYAVTGSEALRGVIQVEPPLMPGETPFHRPPKNYPDLNWPYVSPTPTSSSVVAGSVP